MNDAAVKGGGYFPRKYVTDMLSWLSRNKDVEIITYHDLQWKNKQHADHQQAGGQQKTASRLYDFASEKLAWSSWLKAEPGRKDKMYVLIQYDVDTTPERSNELIADAAHDNVPANVMIFVDRIDRGLLKQTGNLEYTEYDVNRELLLKRERDFGWQIGYHSNAHEKSGFNMHKATEIIADDINKLRQQFTINYYTAHGGIACERGLNNRDVPAPVVNPPVRWVHNGSTPHFDSQFSDGGHNSPARDPEKRDVRDFIKTMQPGKRYRILLHPQYYDNNFNVSKRYSGTRWYDEMIEQYYADNDSDLWQNVTI